MRAALLIALWLACAGVAAGQERTPPECTYDRNGRVDYAACLAVAPEGSPLWRLSLINLGTQALYRRDYAKAVEFYDRAQPARGEFYSDAGFHAYRAEAYSHVGRDADALREARTALAMVMRTGEVPDAVVSERLQLESVDVELVFALALPVLRKAGDPAFAAGLNAHKALPTASHVSLARKVLSHGNPCSL